MSARTARAVLLALAISASAAVGRAADVGTIVYVSPAGELHTVKPDGTGDREIPGGAIESVRRGSEAGASLHLVRSVAPPWRPAASGSAAADYYRWPVASPDGTRVLVFGAAQKDDGPVDGVYVVDTRSGRIFGIHEKPGIASIYAYWSPDGQRATLLDSTGRGVRLSLWAIAGGQAPSALVDGVPPIFWSWSPDARSLLVHRGSPAGGDAVALVAVDSGRQTVLSATPAAFNAPGWSSDGKAVAYPEIAGEKARLVIARADGSSPAFTEARSPLALSWSPRNSVLAVAEGETATSRFTSLRLLRADVDPRGAARVTSEPEPLLREPFAAFFWSPQGDRILYGNPEGAGFRWKVIDVARRKSRALAGFLPSPSFRKLLLYFDQYALSHRLWSPDGKRFLFCGVAERDLANHVSMKESRVYVADATGAELPLAVAEGDMSVWSVH